MTITISEIYIIRYSVISKQGINTSDLCFVSEHPNVRLLITHGGMSSITEAIYAGVPIIGIPLFSDQDANIHSLQNKQVGILLELQTLSKDNVLKAIHTVLDDTRWVNLSCSESSNPMLSKTIIRITTKIITHVFEYSAEIFITENVLCLIVA